MIKIRALQKPILRKAAVVLTMILLSLFIFSGCRMLTGSNQPDFEGYTRIEVDGGDLSGQRQPNLKLI